ncbi:cysteine-rich DPF motif domain-containing protein 1 isoform 5-T5 [Trichechus inunguis]
MRDGIRWHLRQSAVPRACLSASSVLCQLHTATWGRSPPTPALSYALSAETDFLQQLQRSLEGVCPEAPGSRESALSPVGPGPVSGHRRGGKLTDTLLNGGHSDRDKAPLFSLLEESYVLKDPFTADRDKFLVLGSRCSVCSRLVCVGPECSLFYTKRFCLPCVWENIDAFPQEIRQDVDKRKALARTPCGKPSSRT